MAERRTVRYRSAAIDFAHMQLHMQSRCAYIPRGQVVLSGSACAERARASERPQLIKPPRNLYQHYTRCFACKNHLRGTPDCPPVLASRQQRGEVLHCPRSLSIQQLGLNRYVIYILEMQKCETCITVIVLKQKSRKTNKG